MEYMGDRFENKTMTEKEVREAEFTDCVFARCKFTETEFIACRFEGVRFDNCSFVNVKFRHSAMFSSRFRECAFVNFSFASLVKSYGQAKACLPFSSAEECTFKYVSFVGFDMKKTPFKNRTLSTAISTTAI